MAALLRDVAFYQRGHYLELKSSKLATAKVRLTRVFRRQLSTPYRSLPVTVTKYIDINGTMKYRSQ